MVASSCPLAAGLSLFVALLTNEKDEIFLKGQGNKNHSIPDDRELCLLSMLTHFTREFFHPSLIPFPLQRSDRSGHYWTGPL